jgi:hypothetical protein
MMNYFTPSVMISLALTYRDKAVSVRLVDPASVDYTKSIFPSGMKVFWLSSVRSRSSFAL